MAFPAPFVSSVSEIPDDWMQGQATLPRHFYSVIFDRAGEEAFDLMGMGAEYARSRAMTYYTAESHISYLRPLTNGAHFSVSFQVLDHDDKRIRSLQQLMHADGWTAAVCETLSLHVDMSGPKVVPFPQDIRARVDGMAAAQEHLTVPDTAGKGIQF